MAPQNPGLPKIPSDDVHSLLWTHHWNFNIHRKSKSSFGGYLRSFPPALTDLLSVSLLPEFLGSDQFIQSFSYTTSIFLSQCGCPRCAFCLKNHSPVLFAGPNPIHLTIPSPVTKPKYSWKCSPLYLLKRGNNLSLFESYHYCCLHLADDPWHSLCCVIIISVHLHSPPKLKMLTEMFYLAHLCTPLERPCTELIRTNC